MTCCIVELRTSFSYSSLYLSDILLVHTLNNEIFFITDFSSTLQAGIVIYGIQIDDNLLCCRVKN